MAVFSTSIRLPRLAPAYPITDFAMPLTPIGWPVSTSCSSPMHAPVAVPAMALRRLMAKNSVTMNGRSRIASP